MLDWLRGDPYPFLRTVLVHTKTDQSFRGALWEERRGFLVLRKAELLLPRNETKPLDGDTLIDRTNVSFVQVLGEPS